MYVANSHYDLSLRVRVRVILIITTLLLLDLPIPYVIYSSCTERPVALTAALRVRVLYNVLRLFSRYRYGYMHQNFSAYTILRNIHIVPATPTPAIHTTPTPIPTPLLTAALVVVCVFWLTSNESGICSSSTSLQSIEDVELSPPSSKEGQSFFRWFANVSVKVLPRMLGIVYCLWGIGCSPVGKKGLRHQSCTISSGSPHHHPYLRSFKHLIHTSRTSRLCENRVLVTLEITARPGYQGAKEGVGVGGGGCVECAGEAAFGCPIAIIRETLSVKVGRDGETRDSARKHTSKHDKPASYN